MITKIFTEKSEINLNIAINDYLKRYNPAGYGTSVERKYINNNGLHCAVITRYNSCD